MASTTKPRTGSRTTSTFLLLVTLAVSVAIWAILKFSAPLPVIVYAEQEEEAMDFRQSCRLNTILNESLSECYKHQYCNLGNDEMFLMYETRKIVIIDCKKADLVDIYRHELNRAEELKQRKLDDFRDVVDPV
ncbi:hypothetical protein LCGC14_0373020 [marine sediment metagenome]|uniref:Uncharacterized protein n=1 Tax=marine sediment metagenome TaxID=412755 RepID=A0A0F9TME1_9ZZZZ